MAKRRLVEELSHYHVQAELKYAGVENEGNLVQGFKKNDNQTGKHLYSTKSLPLWQTDLYSSSSWPLKRGTNKKTDAMLE